MSRFKIKSMGDAVEGVEIKGDRKNPELDTFRVSFPFGHVEVVRCSDATADPSGMPDYWVHVYVNNPRATSYCPDGDCGEYSRDGEIKDARLDQADKHASETDLGDFTRPELYHLAVKVGTPR